MITERRARWRRRLLWLLVILALLPALIWGLVPKEPVELAARFDPAFIGDDPAAYLARREAVFDDIVPGAEKTILWAEDEGARTETVLVYIHGFSATAEEIRPVPEAVAEEIGANLVFTRLAGHGRDGEAMATARISDWMFDLDEALAIAGMIGDRTILIGTSTGATLAAVGLANGRTAEGAIFISPNFRIANPLAAVLTLPGARHWVPPLFGDERSFEPLNEDHERFWTTAYPTEALFPMAALVEAAGAVDYGAVDVPALFYFSEADAVVDHAETRAVAEDWGGPATVVTVDLTEGDDPLNHVIAGDILSPGMNDATVAAFGDWIRGLD